MAWWSDREVARRCGVSNTFVSNLRPAPSGESPQIERTVQRNGTTYTQNVAAINADRPRAEPQAALIEQPTWRDNATPEAVAKFGQLNRETWSGNVSEILRLMSHLPSADEYDAAQERGEVATRADQNLLPHEKKVSVADLDLTHKDIHEARQIRDAEVADAGAII